MADQTSKKIAFFWDESFLWGLMAYKALKELGLPFDLVRAEEIRAGQLSDYGMLFVPGGWASNKGKRLGESGIRAIQDFVAGGGNYLGFCGGAGLATKAKGSIGLLNVKRRLTKERVPSFSGRVELNINKHPIWSGLRKGKARYPQGTALAPTVFHAWWPSQFIIEESDIKVLAVYGKALPDSFSSDLNVGDTEANGGWKELEDVYKINLDPARLVKEPSIIEGGYGKGKVILSLVHFDTPGDMNGQRMLMNLWEYLAGQKPEERQKSTDNRACLAAGNEDDIRFSLLALCSDLIALGERNFLWFWRNPMLLQWRRGVRGLEYNTLYILIKEISEIISRSGTDRQYAAELENTRNLLLPFIEKAKQLLVLERHAMQKGHITYEKCDNPEIKKIRTELFSDSKSYGGMFKELIDEVDSLLFSLISPGKI